MVRMHFSVIKFILLCGLSALLVESQIVFPDGPPLPQGQNPPPLGGGGPPRRRPPPPPRGSAPHQQGPPPPGPNAPPRESLLFPREQRLPKKRCTNAAGKEGVCILMIQCAIFSSEINSLMESPCQITEDQEGVCCEKPPPPPRDPSKVVNRPPRRRVPRPNVNMNRLNSAASHALQRRKQRKELERELVFNNIVPDSKPVFLHAALFGTTSNVVDKADKANVALETSLSIVKDNNLTNTEAEFGLNEIDISSTIIGDNCPAEPICPETKYRTLDGSCNNLKNKDWGQAVTAFQRLLPPKYADGMNTPRRSSDSRLELPSARLVSQVVTVPQDVQYRSFTLMVMQWGQFLDHDITHTPLSKGSGQSPISCCSGGKLRRPTDLHPECFPIVVPETDRFYSQFGLQCMEFVRSLPAIRKQCKFGPREQMSQITAYIDASNVYGSNSEIGNSVREFRGGRLLVNNHEGRHMLPQHPNALGCGSTPPFCFRAGDVRVNEQPDLVVLHTVWMRQHNKIADALAQLNPSWSDEIIFQETRRIIAAQMQHVTYNEYLPVVLGREFMTNYGLIPQTTGYTQNYVETVDATITNAFATAAFRFGHTMVSGSMKGFSSSGTVDRELPLSSSQFAPFFLYDRGAVDSMIRGLVKQPSSKFDSHFTREVTNRLFAQNGSFGMDLVALNIQRGRDHGLPSYNDWRKVCHLPVAQQFTDFSDVMDRRAIAKLREAYSSPNDVDLFVGGILESPKTGSLLGPTFLCIVGDQFSRLKIGDRFYYENGQFNSKFSESQLEQIRKTSLARILCDNSDNIQNIQPLAFVNAGVSDGRSGFNGNNIAACNDERVIPKMSLDPWRNEPVWN